MSARFAKMEAWFFWGVTLERMVSGKWSGESQVDLIAEQTRGDKEETKWKCMLPFQKACYRSRRECGLSEDFFLVLYCGSFQMHTHKNRENIMDPYALTEFQQPSSFTISS